MLQRASLCRALIHDPQLLMLDEPFGALDQFTREELWGDHAGALDDAEADGDSGHARSAGGRLPRQPHLRDAARPGRIIDDSVVPFARPRTMDMTYDPDFTVLTQRLRAADHARARRAQGGRGMNSQLRRQIASAALIIGFFVAVGGALPRLRRQRHRAAAARADLHHAVARLPAIWPHAVQTLYTTMVGFVLGIVIGVLIGALIGSSRLAYDVAYPLLIGFSSIPKVAVVPIFVLWFGAGTVPAVLTAMILSIFPIVVNVATGLATTEPELEDVMRA